MYTTNHDCTTVRFTIAPLHDSRLQLPGPTTHDDDWSSCLINFPVQVTIVLTEVLMTCIILHRMCVFDIQSVLSCTDPPERADKVLFEASKELPTTVNDITEIGLDPAGKFLTPIVNDPKSGMLRMKTEPLPDGQSYE